MLTKGDDYPLHQTPEPMAVSGGDRNFYDRYFFNGYDPSGTVFFAAALGVYPQLDVMDAAFCVVVDGRQYNLRASKHLASERLDMTVGPITVRIVEPLHTLQIIVAANDGPLTADLTFTVRHDPIEEPRFIRRLGPRLMMDYTRMTQNGCWSGWLGVDGVRHDITPELFLGTRDRSWGIRSVGAAESQPPAGGNFGQFWWLWMPINFPGFATFFHSNDDGEGRPWNRRGVVAPLSGEDIEFDTDALDLDYHPGGRRIKQVRLDTPQGGKLVITTRPANFFMSGLGYLHPVWGHGLDHGALEVGHDVIEPGFDAVADVLNIHIQALADAVLTIDGKQHHGVGVVEQLFIGPHAASGLTGLLDPAA